MSVIHETDVATDAAVAAAIDDAPESSGAHATSPVECPNCGTPRVGSYCSSCGQKAMPLRPTVHYFAHELTHELLHFDGKIFRSLRLLLTRPGFLTREIFAGRRASYISPIRLYLLASVVAFAIGAFGTLDQANLQYIPEAGDSEATIRQGEAQLEAAERAFNTAMNVWLPRAMFVLVPLFAALVMLFRRGSGLTYPQHLYFALHVHAAGFFAYALDSLFEAVAVLGFAASAMDVATELYMLGYFFVAFRRVYETTIAGTLWRGLTIAFIYLAILLLVFLAIGAPAVWPLFTGGST
jgi:hypothetical protein